ncbi:hypothetical protein [Marivirga sp.]|uniref:hypothetical protein n=1 Tax=Marivirga sp. TaxID=2018662 RepID=UPI0025DDC4F6|nr:hypothetical protein [Marivirga sp.]
MNKILIKAEMVLLALLAVAVVLELLDTKLSILYIISLAGLGIVFFLFAQIPSQAKIEGSDFNSLLGLSIVPRVLWISTAITTVGVLFYLQGFAGAFKLLSIGGITIAICTLILIILRVINVKGLEQVIPILYRSYPALLAAAYFIFA